MHSPAHPGEILREDIIPALDLTVAQAAEALGINRVTLSRVLNGRAGVTPAMALRIEKWLGADKGGRAGLWVDMQAAYDLAQARKDKDNAAAVRKVKPAKLHASA
jgi:addiction module HigA family antidote